MRADESQNILTNSEAQQIWTPALTFLNTEKQDKTIVDNRTMIFVKREGSYLLSHDNRIKNQYLYSGSENNLTMSRVYSTHWLCEYKMMSYPFDTQVINNLYKYDQKLCDQPNY